MVDETFRSRRFSAAPAPVALSLQLDLEGMWRHYMRLYAKDRVVLSEEETSEAYQGALIQAIGADVTMLNQSWVLKKLHLLERQRFRTALEMQKGEEEEIA